jgi:hypothetical protein
LGEDSAVVGTAYDVYMPVANKTSVVVVRMLALPEEEEGKE